MQLNLQGSGQFHGSSGLDAGARDGQRLAQGCVHGVPAQLALVLRADGQRGCEAPSGGALGAGPRLPCRPAQLCGCRVGGAVLLVHLQQGSPEGVTGGRPGTCGIGNGESVGACEGGFLAGGGWRRLAFRQSSTYDHDVRRFSRSRAADAGAGNVPAPAWKGTNCQYSTGCHTLHSVMSPFLFSSYLSSRRCQIRSAGQHRVLSQICELFQP
jgi:hypothetical protein